MFGDRRSHPRVTVNRVARIYAEQAGVNCECTITDISEGGARLFVPEVNLPEQFVLLISGDKVTREECRVAWRLGGEMGVQFVTRSVEQARAPVVNELRALAQRRFRKSGAA
ncbi:MAG: PilZ domain-containing protein [Xanthobacteraceae bacterium]|nr:PilZ domain-containing protein [Xanthobacteraceae bacterium]